VSTALTATEEDRFWFWQRVDEAIARRSNRID
jgi:hypothetical protein